MNEGISPALCGTVASLHLHPPAPGAPLQQADSIEVITGKGILGEPRYFERRSRATGKLTRRQVSLIEREQITQHAFTLGLDKIPPGAVRANIETTGVDLIALIGRDVVIGSAILHFYEPRKPCEKMDAICVGLRELMEPNRQGVMAEVVQSGRISVGDRVEVYVKPPRFYERASEA